MANYFALHEVDPSNVTRNDSSIPTDVAIVIEHGTFAWDQDADPVLTDVNLMVKKGDLVVVHGPVGSGKSSLCSALLGEMEKTHGKVSMHGKVAYYSQQPWIQNMTVRENILFGHAYDRNRYQSVLNVCGLLPDLQQFPGGDATEIGQKGINLSGDQKARVSLARACYSDADVFIFDSPLAAVDAVEVIESGAASREVSVLDGHVSVQRPERQRPRTHFAMMVSSHNAIGDGNTTKLNDGNVKDAGRLIEDEEREEGRVSAASLWQGCQVGSDLWLSHWTGQKGNTYDASRTQYNMTVYALLGAGSSLMVLERALTVAIADLRASRDLFRLLTHGLLSAPLRFFDVNPIGRIVNRFGGDITYVEIHIPFDIGSLLVTVFFTFCQLATAIYIVNILIVFIVPLAYLYVKFAKFYLMPSREISRLLKVASSPVLSHISQVEEGVTTIRAFG
ncbi:hypothetical protein PHYPSEUDO_011929 [Phytophthora pseudosyringae]|uniref:ABC transmembrane type-1 domain-containing protein n=1 Tax=Phytophthora pseudosyringae TaxID=221518 RepID=A0A8T1VB17_9STRA|nr:hypothetical protein PHYPSEUDO_011929 [Phytophthora pseudosyringae]